MSGTIDGARKANKTLLEKFNGDEEALKKWRQEIGRRGGKSPNYDPHLRPFAQNRKQASIAGKKGGTKSRRTYTEEQKKELSKLMKTFRGSVLDNED